jgi:uncharacterized protein YdeI (YjbR/CyaY-like superfamily)
VLFRPQGLGLQMIITFFKSSSEFREWLEENHEKFAELLVGFYKKSSGKTGITYPEAVNEALCFGWIDGIKKRVDGVSYTHRFTPRKSRSTWSLINIRRAGELRKLGQMTPSGLKAFEARDLRRSGIYAFENRPRKLDAICERRFRANKKAWDCFQSQPPGYQRTASWWVMSAKKDGTRLRRLVRLMNDSEKGQRLAIVSSASKKAE